MNGNGAMNGNGNMPWWVKAVGVVGIPGTIALYVLYLLAGVMADARTDHQNLITEARGSLTRLREHDEHTVRTLAILELICRRLGRNDYERESCDRTPGGSR